MDKIAIKYDKHLTELAKSIFGNVVEKAYYTTWDFGNSSKAEILERLKWIQSKYADSIDISNGIWIKFTTGKIVEFSSRWRAICPAEIDKSYEVAE